MSDSAPLISIVLLAYNQASLVRESIESVLQQDYENLEILLSDDCSTDTTYKIILDYAANYSGPHRLLVNRNERNLGIGAHVEYAVSLTRGDYIVMAGGDDISLPGRVSLSMDVIQREGELGAVIGRFHPFTGVFRDTGEWQPKYSVDGYVLKPGSDDWFKLSSRGKLVGMPGAVAMWNRKLFTLFGPISELVIAEDVVLANRCLISGLGVGFSGQNFVLYRCHDNNIYSGSSKSEFERKVFNSRAFALYDLRLFRRKFPDLHTPRYWQRVTQLLEGTLFRSIVQIRKPYIGRLKSRCLYWLGLRRT
jgi:glycosyltransferase involved in cell wall biosynthesis